MRKAVNDFVKGLPDKLRGNINQDDIEYALRRQDVRRRLDAGAAVHEQAGELGEAVRQAKKQLNGAIISEIDKERGMLFIM